MNRFFSFILIIFLTGCLTPTQKDNAAKSKVEKSEKAIQSNKESQLNKATGYTFAADYSLNKDPSPSAFSVVAKDMTRRSLLASGVPEAKTGLEYQKIVDGLISTNEQEKVSARIQLDRKDKELILIQSKVSQLEKAKTKAEEERDKISEENAKYANLVVRIKRILNWIKWGIICVIVLRICSLFLPPPYNIIGSIFDSIFGGLFKLGSKVLPKAKEAAGLVSLEVHRESEETLKSLVAAIQKIRDTEVKPQDIEVNPTNLKIKKLIDPILKDYTNKETSRRKIIDIKTNLGHI